MDLIKPHEESIEEEYLVYGNDECVIQLTKSRLLVQSHSQAGLNS